MQGFYIYFAFVLYTSITSGIAKQNVKNNSVEEVSDIKNFKKILRTKNNVLVCFISSQRQAVNIVKSFTEAADVIKGQGAMLLIDCSGEGKKLCKKLKVTPEPYTLRHYKDGDFNKVYDRKEIAASIVTFMRDPTGDIPWEEDEASVDIVHIPDISSLLRLIKKDTRPIMIMFYAPWCGYCKQLKPEYAAAASTLKAAAVMAAIDVNRPENQMVRITFNITGFPTMLYFKNGEMKFTYEGENKKDSIVAFMKDPTAVPIKPKDEDWSLTPSDITHLNTTSFDPYMQGESSTLVMFYAPWCGHCNKMKPEFEKAATQIKTEEIAGSLVAVDATKEGKLGKRYGVKGYPTLKYFKDGEFVWDVPALREADKIVEFMRAPKEPPPPPPPEPDWADQPSEVVHLDSETFKPFLKKKRHVLVMFYAPWCGHCKMAKPEFVAAAESLKDNLRVAFAAVDCTKHSAVCSSVGVSGYPTIKYYHYYNKQANSEYHGGRKAHDFIGFMTKADGKPGQATTEPPKTDTTAKKKNLPAKKELIWSNLVGGDKIYHVTDKNYKAILEKHKSILIFFYGQSCVDCEKYMAEFANAASNMEPHSKTIMAACETSLNPTVKEEYGVDTLPTIKYFKDGKYWVDYTTKIVADEVLKFVKSPPDRIKTEL